MGTKSFYKHKQFGQVYCDEPLLTPVGRFSWPSLAAPKDPPPPTNGQPPGAPRYEITLLLAKNDPKVEEFKNLVQGKIDLMTPIFNDKRPAKLTFGEPFQDGDDAETFDPEKYPFYAGMWAITARNQNKPQVFDNKKQTLDPTKVLGGMRGKLVLTPFLHGTGIKYKLEVAQFVSDDGVRFGGGVRDMSSILGVCDEEGNTIEGSTEETPEVSQRAQIAATGKAKGKAAAVNLL